MLMLRASPRSRKGNYLPTLLKLMQRASPRSRKSNYLHGEAKVVVEEEEEWMNAYEELCQHIEGQPEQDRCI